MRYGFTVEWKTRKIDKATGEREKKSFTSESMTEVEKKYREMKAKGYKVSGIMQCIF